MAATEDDLAELGRTLRAEFTEQIDTLRQELSVQITEAGNRTTGVSLDEVKALLEEIGVTGERLTVEDVQALLVPAEPFDDEELKSSFLKLTVFANGLADRLGAPRMEG